MKKYNFFQIVFVVLLIFSLFSCGKSQHKLIVTEEDNSLRNQMAYLDNGIDWTEPLDDILVDKEGTETLGASSDSNKVVPPGLQEISFYERLFYPKNAPALEPVYPEIQGFGSLDTRALNSKAEETIRTFIEAQNDKKLDLDCISPENRFLQPVFLKNFEFLQPVTEIIIGKPLIVQDEHFNEYQVPVRMITDKGFYNTVFFMVYENDKYYIEQIFYGSLKVE